MTPETACASAEEAARAVIGVQAQDLRAAQLALRSRVPGLARRAVHAAPLGVATGTWALSKGRPEPTWFGRAASTRALAGEATDIERFLTS